MINKISTNTNFNGAYIIKGSQKAVTRFENEINMRRLVNKNTQVMTMPLTDEYHKNQPYAELLVCTGDNIKNLQLHLQKVKKEQEKNLKRFVSDFNSWKKPKQDRFVKKLKEAIMLSNSERNELPAPGETAMKNGKPDSFLEWFAGAKEKSDMLYRQISTYGQHRFPEKIRRLDAKKAFSALISSNFNIKEGFIRNPKAPDIEVEFLNNKEIRYNGNKIQEILTYKENSAGEKILETYEKFTYAKDGSVKTRTFSNI